MEAFKYDATIEEAIIQAGISYDQLKYFRDQHPEFYMIEARCRELPNLMARVTVVSNLTTDVNLAFRYLERKKPAEFGQKDKSPIVIIPISMREVAKEYQPTEIN